MTVTLTSFNRLPWPLKLGLLEEDGVYLEVSRSEGRCTVALYSLFNFYVEVWMDRSADKIKKAEAFMSYRRLDPFLTSVDLAGLFA